MSYGEVAFTIAHYDNNGVKWQVSIRKLDYIGASTQYEASGNIFELSYQESDDLFTPFLASDLSVNIVFTQQSDFNLINDIANSSDLTYQMWLYRNDEPVWVGYIDKGLLSYIEGSFPLPITLRAICGIGMWEKLSYDAEGLILGSDVLYYLVNGTEEKSYFLKAKDQLNKIAQTFSHNIDWSVPQEAPKDILEAIGSDDGTWITGDEDNRQPVSQKSVAEQWAKRFLARWYQWRGWRLDQVEGKVRDTPYRRWIQNGTSYNQFSAPSTVVATPSNFNQLSVEYRPPISSSIVTYEHGLDGLTRIIRSENTVLFNTNNVDYVYSSGDKIAFELDIKPSASADVYGTLSTSASGLTTILSTTALNYTIEAGQSIDLIDPNNPSQAVETLTVATTANVGDTNIVVNSQVLLGTYPIGSEILLNKAKNLFITVVVKVGESSLSNEKWWNSDIGAWVDSVYTNRFTLAQRNTDGVFPIQFQTTTIPEDRDSLVFTISPIQESDSILATSGNIIATDLFGSVFIDGAESKSGNSLVTQAITANSGTEVYDLGTLYIAEGVSKWDDNGLAFSDGTIIDQRGDGSGVFRSTGISPSLEDIDRLSVRTINRFYKTAKTALIGTLNKTYEPYQLLEYGSKKYIFCGGRITGDGYWDGLWLEATYEDESVTFANYINSASQRVPSGTGALLGNVLSLQFDRQSGIEAEQITRITSPINQGSTVTSISVLAQSGEVVNTLKQGYKVSLLDIFTGFTQTFTIASDYAENDTSISIVSSTANFDFPIGSVLLLTGEALRSYILKTAQSVAIGVSSSDLQSIAEINGDVLTSANPHTSIPITNLGYPLTDGQKVRLVQAATPTNFDEVEIAADASEGATSMSIISKSLTYNYAAGDRVVFTVAQASGLLAIQVDEAAASASAALTAQTNAETAEGNVNTAIAGFEATVDGVNATTVVKSITNANGTQSIASARFDTTPTSSNITLAAENIDLVSVKNEINKIADISGTVTGTVTTITISSLDIRDPLQIGDVVYLVKASNNAQFDRVTLRAILDVSDSEILVDSTALTYAYDTGDLVVIDYQSSTALISQSVTNINSEIVLKAATSEDNVATIKLEAIDGSNANTAIRLDADEITITGTTFINELMGQELTIQTGGFVSSSNFATGSAGWRISQTSAEFNDVTIRGTLDGADGSFSGSLSAATGTFSGSLSAVDGTLNTLTIAGSGYIQSTGYTATNGFRINADGSANFQDITIGGSSSTIGDGAVLNDLTVSGTLSLTGTTEDRISSDNFTVKGDGEIAATKGTIGGLSLASNSISTTNFSVTSAGLLTASNAVITGTITATDGSLSNLDISGALTVQSGGSIVGSNYSFDDSGGNIAGWDIQNGLLRSASVNARIELNKTKNRVSIFSPSNEESVIVGYLDGVPKNDGTGNWSATNYGFWVRQSDFLTIDGDVEYVEGDWLIEGDASYLVKSGDNNVIRLGTDSVSGRGLFFYKNDANETQIASLTPNQLTIGESGEGQLSYNASTGKMTIDGDVDISGTLQSVNGTFSGALSAVTGTLGALSIEGALTLGTGGSINLANNFTVDSSGNVTVSGALTAGANSSINGIYIVDATIDNAKIADATITSAKIDEIQANKITISSVSENTLFYDNFEIEESNWILRDAVSSTIITQNIYVTISGTITQVFVFNLDYDLKVGQKIRLFKSSNPSQYDEVFVSQDVSAATGVVTINVFEKTLTYSYTSSDDIAYLVSSVDYLATESLLSAISGTITQVPVTSLADNLRAGQKIRIFKTSDKDEFDEVTVANDVTASVSSTIIPVESQALTYSYTTDDDILYTPTTYVYEEWEISNATPYAYQGDYYLRRTGSDDVDKYAFNKQRINLEYGKTEFLASVYGRTNNSLSALSNGTSIGVAFYDKYGAQLKFGYSGLFQDAHHQGTTWKELGVRVKMTNNGVIISYTDINNTGKLSQTFENADIAYCYVYLYSGEFNNFFDQFKVQPVLGSVQIQDGAITADKIDVNDLFAQDANITGTLTLGSGSGNGSITSTELNMYDVTLDSSGLIVGSEASGNDFLKVTPTSFTYGNDQSGLLTIAQPTGNIAITFSNGKMFINGNEVAFV